MAPVWVRGSRSEAILRPVGRARSPEPCLALAGPIAGHPFLGRGFSLPWSIGGKRHGIVWDVPGISGNLRHAVRGSCRTAPALRKRSRRVRPFRIACMSVGGHSYVGRGNPTFVALAGRGGFVDVSGQSAGAEKPPGFLRGFEERREECLDRKTFES